MAAAKKTNTKKAKAKKKQEYRNLFKGCKISKNSTNVNGKPLICQFQGSSKAHGINQLDDAIRWVQNKYNIIIQLDTIKVPDDITDVMHSNIEEALHNLIYDTYSVPFQQAIKNVITAHGNGWKRKLKKHNISPNDIVYSQDPDGDTWYYDHFDYECKSVFEVNENDENEDVNDYYIFFMGPRLPQLRTLFLEYNGPFTLNVPAQSGADIIIKTLKGGMMLTIGNNQPYHVSVFRSVYIRDDLSFSYTMDDEGGLLDITFSNTRVPCMSFSALESAKESRMAHCVDEEDQSEDSQD